MTHAQKLRIMGTTLVVILFAIVLWIIVQLAIGVNAQAAKDDARSHCLMHSSEYSSYSECLKQEEAR